MSQMTMGDEIHALRTERASILKELEQVKAERDALAVQLEALRAPAVELADTVENRDDLPLHKWALKCARLVPQVQNAGKETSIISLARHDAELLQWAVDHVRSGRAHEFLSSHLADIDAKIAKLRRQAEASVGHVCENCDGDGYTAGVMCPICDGNKRTTICRQAEEPAE